MVVGEAATGASRICRVESPRVRSLWMSKNMQSQTPFYRRTVAIPVSMARNGRPKMAEPPNSIPELPPPNVKRWTVRRKAAVVTAIARGILTHEEACERYQLTEEELGSWQRSYEEHGLPGLRSTRLQQYRVRQPRR
jgi:Protein of unknown function (DUF1153)